MVADKGKKLKVADKNEEENTTTTTNNNNQDEIDTALVLSIEKLQEVQDELDKINELASDEVLAIEQKYNKMRTPAYEKRNDIIKTIPDFWLTAFLSHPALLQYLTDEDQKIFKYLSSLEVEDAEDVKSGYSITFNFKPNPYFEDTTLVKSFSFLDEGTTKVTSTSIKWKEGMGIPNGVVNNKGKKRQHAEESFFTWFSESKSTDAIDELHDEIADIIKDDLWPNPLNYFHSEEADEEESSETDDDDVEEEAGSEEEEEAADDDDEDGEEEEDGEGEDDE